MSGTTVPLAEADFATLRQYALAIGIEVKHGFNSAQLRARIEHAEPGVTDIPLTIGDAPPSPAAEAPAAPDNVTSIADAVTAAPATAPRYSVNNPSADPKVAIRVHKTSDPTREKEVTIIVLGHVTRIRRGEKVEVPYRVFKALDTAIEKRAVPSDRVNSFGTVEYDYEEVHSYPFDVLAMPPAEEIAAYDAAVRNQQARAA